MDAIGKISCESGWVGSGDGSRTAPRGGAGVAPRRSWRHRVTNAGRDGRVRPGAGPEPVRAVRSYRASPDFLAGLRTTLQWSPMNGRAADDDPRDLHHAPAGD